METNRKLDLIAKMIKEFSDTEEIVEFLTGIAGRLRQSTPDLAKERWGFVSTADRIILLDGELGPYLVCRDRQYRCASNEQMELMAAAPEMLDVLEEVSKAIQRHFNDGRIYLPLTGEFAKRIQAVIKKARGGE